jgi:hypothetical protein
MWGKSSPQAGDTVFLGELPQMRHQDGERPVTEYWPRKKEGTMPFFEPLDKLDPRHVDLERARKSLREELEAIDYYQERIDATEDASLKQLLAHNMNEEKEHAAMLIEWLRKNDTVQDQKFKEHD